LHIVWDCLEEGSPATVLPGMIRQARARGGAGPLVCYAPSQHFEARQRIAKGEKTREVAKVFNVSISTISRLADAR
jgi:hypothetical protein